MPTFLRPCVCFEVLQTVLRGEGDLIQGRVLTEKALEFTHAMILENFFNFGRNGRKRHAGLCSGVGSWQWEVPTAEGELAVVRAADLSRLAVEYDLCPQDEEAVVVGRVYWELAELAGGRVGAGLGLFGHRGSARRKW